MNVVVFLLTVLIVVVVSGGPAWKDVQRGSGLKIGQGGGKNSTSPRGNGIRLGGSTRGGRQTTTTSQPDEEQIFQPTSPAVAPGHTQLHIGIVVPHKSFFVREYTKAATSAISKQRKLRLFKTHDIQFHIVMQELTPSPKGNCTGVFGALLLASPAHTRLQLTRLRLYLCWYATRTGEISGGNLIGSRVR